MFEFLRGIVSAIKANGVVLDVNGVGYFIQMANPFVLSQMMDQTVTLYVHQLVREDALLLFGFMTEDEKHLFLKLISVTGIGPKSALSILANGDVDHLVQAIETDQLTYLTKFPGIGKKTASQIVLDLKGKLTAFHTSKSSEVLQAPSDNPILEEVKSALLGLGYSEKEIAKIEKQLAQETFDDASSGLRLSLKLMMGSKKA